MRHYGLIGSFLALVACGSSSRDPDAAALPDTSPPDTAMARVDAATPDAPQTDAPGPDALSPDTGASRPDAPTPDAAAAKPDAPAPDAAAPDSAPPDTANPDTRAADAYDPGPVVPVVVNSANTATYSLGNGQWKRFSFPAEAGQLYSISELSGTVHGYLGADPTVSPTNFLAKTSDDGTLAFPATATQTYYLAVASIGGGSSGSFQIADGGKPLPLGTSTVTLSAPNKDDYTFFRFPVSPGKAYRCQVTGTATSLVGLGLSPKAERSSMGQFQTSLVGVSGPLPMAENIPATSVALSYSGFYYFFLRVYEPMTLAITLSESSP